MDEFPIDFRTFRRSSTPNQCLALPANLASEADADLTSPVFRTVPRLLRDAFEAAVAREPRLEQVAASDDGLQLELIQRSRWLGFRDRITVAFLPLDALRSAPAVWSRAEVGYYDFGVNRKRVGRWLDRLAEAHPGVLERPRRDAGRGRRS
ncbi:MAG TPA: DUF1499 domain-containing protein [Geminicoccaceae bacterium]